MWDDPESFASKLAPTGSGWAARSYKQKSPTLNWRRMMGIRQVDIGLRSCKLQAPSCKPDCF